MPNHRKNGIEDGIEALLFRSRWLLAPLYIGLVGALLVLVVKFIQKFYKDRKSVV